MSAQKPPGSNKDPQGNGPRFVGVFSNITNVYATTLIFVLAAALAYFFSEAPKWLSSIPLYVTIGGSAVVFCVKIRKTRNKHARKVMFERKVTKFGPDGNRISKEKTRLHIFFFAKKKSERDEARQITPSSLSNDFLWPSKNDLTPSAGDGTSAGDSSLDENSQE